MVETLFLAQLQQRGDEKGEADEEITVLVHEMDEVEEDEVLLPSLPDEHEVNEAHDETQDEVLVHMLVQEDDELLLQDEQLQPLLQCEVDEEMVHLTLFHERL